jgi:hypothetical protein
MSLHFGRPRCDRVVEQQQLDPLGVLREDAEVDAIAMDGRAERCARAFLDIPLTNTHRPLARDGHAVDSANGLTEHSLQLHWFDAAWIVRVDLMMRPLGA